MAVCGSLFLATASAQEARNDREWPDVKTPGPDLGNFPNGAFTLPKGRSYLEMAPLTWETASTTNPSRYYWPYLLRYGVTDDLEMRLMGDGLQSIFGSAPITGFSPITFDMKVHLWDDQKEVLVPAASLEVSLKTDWGTPAFSGGYQPSINMNFDFPITESIELEWTIGYTGIQNPVNVAPSPSSPNGQSLQLSEHQFSFQWAIQKELCEEFQVFVHGFYNGAIKLEPAEGTMAGVGFFWYLSKSLVMFSSCNAGLSPSAPPLMAQWGFTWAP